MHCGVASALCLAIVTAQDAGPRSPDTMPSTLARMYTRSSQRTWATVLTLLHELKIGIDDRDDEARTLVTRWKDLEEFEGLRSLELRQGYRPEKFQLHIFVSPFAEPARVHVGSIVDSRRMPTEGRGQFLSPPQIGGWFFARLEQRLGESGRPIPADPRARTALAQELLGRDPQPGCLDVLKRPGHGPVHRPTRIEVGDVRPVYPEANARAREGATIEIVGYLGEDGAVYGIATDDRPSSQFLNSAAGTAMLWRYRPARVDECTVPVEMTFSVRFKAR